MASSLLQNSSLYLLIQNSETNYVGVFLKCGKRLSKTNVSGLKYTKNFT
jgi:hypothetical protein